MVYASATPKQFAFEGGSSMYVTFELQGEFPPTYIGFLIFYIVIRVHYAIYTLILIYIILLK